MSKLIVPAKKEIDDAYSLVDVNKVSEKCNYIVLDIHKDFD